MGNARNLGSFLGNNTSLSTINNAYAAGTLVPTVTNPNLIINGAMEVAQRATSVTGQTGSDVLTVDRFRGHGSGATFNMSQQAVTLGGESGLPIQFTKFLRYDVTTGANNCGVWQALEDVTRVQGTHTLSFYAKGTNPAGGAISLDIRQYFGSGGSSELDDDTRTFSVTSTWQKFTFTTTPTVAGKTIGTSSYYRPFFKQPSSDNGSAAWRLDITGVQLELGDTATPFEHRSYGEELALCQRYCYVIQQENNSVNGNASACNGTYYSATSFYGVLVFPTTMRVPPTLVVPTVTNGYRIYSATGADLRDGTNFGMQSINKDSLCIYVPNVSSTAGFGGWMELIVAGAKFTFDAEL
jgi:hypothetical protein